jgi:hypothetical protein
VLPAPATSARDLDKSVDGYTLLDLGNYATATADTIAIAGDTNPGATGNNFDFASATCGSSPARRWCSGLGRVGR